MNNKPVVFLIGASVWELHAKGTKPVEGSRLRFCHLCHVPVWLSTSTIAVENAGGLPTCHDCAASREDEPIVQVTPETAEQVSDLLGWRVTTESLERTAKKQLAEARARKGTTKGRN